MPRRARLLVACCLASACGGDGTASAGAESSTGATGSTGVTTGEPARDSTGAAPSSGGAAETQGSSTGEPMDCFVEVWRKDIPLSGIALTRAGPHYAVIGRDGAVNSVVAVDDDGALVWGPSEAPGTYDELWWWAGVAGAANGEVFTAVSGDDEAWFEAWSATGASAGALEIPGGRLRVGGMALTGDGDVIVGGWRADNAFEWQWDGEAVLLALSAEGAPLWEVARPYQAIFSVAVDPAGTIFTLTGKLHEEGGSIYVEAFDAAGGELWSVLAGSNGGFASVGPLTPFALTLDGAGGVYTLGQQHFFQKVDEPARDTVLVARYDGSGARAWEVSVDVPLTPSGGGVALAGESVVWAVGLAGESVARAFGAEPTSRLGLHRPDGSAVCDQPGSGRSIAGVVAARPDEVVVLGRDSGGSYVAKYRVLD